ncbi:MAG: hypothetical protein JJ974_03680, partial [Phycisphaerales bacterium]|nr:hypothetical protein [Phycisphaerales bacterium]
MNRAALITLLPLLALSACDQTSNPQSAPTSAEPNIAAAEAAPPSTPIISFTIQTNLLRNQSLEDESPTPWHDLAERSPAWHPFSVSSDEAHSGTHSAQLTIDNTITSTEKPTAILGIVQSIKPKTHTLPTTIKGHYKVTHWTRGTKDQYLQAVFMCTRPSNNSTGINYPTF